MTIYFSSKKEDETDRDFLEYCQSYWDVYTEIKKPENIYDKDFWDWMAKEESCDCEDGWDIEAYRDFEKEELRRELASDTDDYSRSEDGGWFYED